MKVKNKKRIYKSRKNIKIKPDSPVTVILLCDSPGYRMKSYGPISLIDIDKRKLIDLQIAAIKKSFKLFEIILCLGFDAEKVCKYVRSKYNNLNIRVVENQLYNSSNSCESLRLSLNNCSGNRVIICDGNLLLNHQSLKLLDQYFSCVLVEQNPYDTLEIGLNIDDKNEAQFFSFGAKNIWSEVIMLHGKDIIECLRKVIVNYESKTRFIFEAINELINMNYSIKCVPNDKQLIKINNIKTYHNLKDIQYESSNI